MIFALIHDLAISMSNARAGMSVFDTPIAISMLVLASDWIMDESAPNNRTFWIEVDWRSFATADGGGRLLATCP